ncbi:hypothetical protein [Paenibacillus alvei]|uniref:Lipoprotein n=1 Tax=Paenibacillus alvei TaxID=44250 RepID=A0A383RAJ2_PAEAL|nr:hypothetical protein [Paenibacillus alvei]SYX83336.1 conserved exported protein of unknown function [Paenibacillus alvei]
MQLRKVLTLIILSFMISSCSLPKQELDDEGPGQQEQAKKTLKGIYAYEYNAIEPKHLEEVNKWLSESRANCSDTTIFYKSYNENSSGAHVPRVNYMFAKGYKAYEISFVYSIDNEENKGQIYIVPIKGRATDEALVKITYDPWYVFGTSVAEHQLFP